MLHSIDGEGRLLEVSEAWLAALGYRREEVIGRPLSSFLQEDSRRRAERDVLPRFFTEGAVQDEPYRMRCKDGAELEVLVTAVPERDAAGRFVRSLAAVLDVTQRNARVREVEQLAFFDPLTGLPNRFRFRRQLEQGLTRTLQDGTPLALLLLDLDHFKGINDALGHHEGDVLLQRLAERLRSIVPEGVLLARLSGDEFGLLLETPAEGMPELQRFVTRLLEEVPRPLTLGPRDLSITCSVGIACSPEHGSSAGTLLSNADTALVSAKSAGRNTSCLFSPELSQAVAEKLQIKSDLRLALQRNELFLAYQPQVSAADGCIVGVEALLRWNHPQRGVLFPKDFIGVAEESGLIVPIGEWVLRSACLQAARWQRQSQAPLRMAVNISSHQFHLASFVALVEATLAYAGLEPQRLELELTEGIVMEHNEATLLTLADLKVLGVGLAVDDFGTGYSSLSYLKHFPFDRIKIAQEFVRDMPRDTDSMAIVRAILHMAGDLGLATLAEGVESAEQAALLRSYGCGEMQGYFYALPLSPSEFDAMLAAADGAVSA